MIATICKYILITILLICSFEIKSLLICSLWMSILLRTVPIPICEGRCQRPFQADKIIKNKDKIIQNKVSIYLKSTLLPLPASYNENQTIQEWKLRYQFCLQQYVKLLTDWLIQAKINNYGFYLYVTEKPPGNLCLIKLSSLLSLAWYTVNSKA